MLVAGSRVGCGRCHDGHSDDDDQSAAPVVGQPWRFAVTAKSAAGRPLPARMRLQVLRRGTVIGCWKGAAVIKPCTGANAGTWIVFEGKRSGVIAWPARWLGMKLTFQATRRRRRADVATAGTDHDSAQTVTAVSAAMSGLAPSAPPAGDVVALVESLDHLLGDQVACRPLEVHAIVGAHLHELPRVVFDVLREAAVGSCEEEVGVEI